MAPMMDALPGYASALLLIGVANTVPWALGRLLGPRGNWPIDAGVSWRGRRLLGDHKTWRGLVGGVAGTALLAPACGVAMELGALAGASALLADATSSFIKRRLDRSPGQAVPGLDQLPEAVLPLLVLRAPLDLDLADVGGVALVFLALNLAAARLREAPG